MLKVGVIGCGYWGPNLIRNFNELSRSNVVRVADLDESRLKHMRGLYPTIETTKDYRHIITDPEIDIVAIATPVHTHLQTCFRGTRCTKARFCRKADCGIR